MRVSRTDRSSASCSAEPATGFRRFASWMARVRWNSISEPWESVPDVGMTAFRGEQVETEQRSSRTGQVDSIGGITGSAVYEGALEDFVPILRAAEWTGVGRQTVWGK